MYQQNLFGIEEKIGKYLTEDIDKIITRAIDADILSEVNYLIKYSGVGIVYGLKETLKEIDEKIIKLSKDIKEKEKIIDKMEDQISELNTFEEKDDDEGEYELENLQNSIQEIYFEISEVEEDKYLFEEMKNKIYQKL